MGVYGNSDKIPNIRRWYGVRNNLSLVKANIGIFVLFIKVKLK
jgi:hypothetical protein